MKLTDIYPGITIRDFNFDLSSADVVINGAKYRLARIYRQADERFSDFSYNVIFPRKKRSQILNISDIIFVSDEFAENPVDWRIVDDREDMVKDNICYREYRYYITRNDEPFIGYFSTRNSAENMLQMIKRHPFDFDMIDWNIMVGRYPVEFLGIPAKIREMNLYKDLRCTLDFSDSVSSVKDDPHSLLEKIKVITNAIERDTSVDGLIKYMVFDIDYDDFIDDKIINLSILNPYISWEKIDEDWKNRRW